VRSVGDDGLPDAVLARCAHTVALIGLLIWGAVCRIKSLAERAPDEGASWNLSLVEDIGRINALQLRAAGGDSPGRVCH
jgi:hypothetical protein